MAMRPMFVTDPTDGHLFFASGVRPLLSAMGGTPILNDAKLSELLSPLYIEDEAWSDPTATMFRGIRSLEHGTTLAISKSGQISSERWWNPPTALRRDLRSAEEFATEFKSLYMKVVSDHVDTHFPVAADLSGGCLLYTSPSPRDQRGSRMPSSA